MQEESFMLKELQGLRAVAVLAVIFVHLNADLLPGGFIGVDIFLVISGFIITSNLFTEYEKHGRISLRSFYAKRVLRLFPALITVVVLTVAYGYLTLSQPNFESLVRSAKWSIVSMPNVYFWLTTSYFDLEAASKPLLHLWSLGVEEQFYLTWPFFLMLILKISVIKNKKLVLLLGASAIVLLSFSLNYIWAATNFASGTQDLPKPLTQFAYVNESLFYLMPFRAFEFAVGAFIVVYFKSSKRINALIAELLFGASAIALAIEFLAFSGEVIFPYTNGLIVSVTSLLLIISAPMSRAGRALLGNRVMVFIGGASYSLYLVHWPMIVFAKNLGHLQTLPMQIAFLIPMFIAGVLLHTQVEKRFRRPTHSAKVGPQQRLLMKPVAVTLSIMIAVFGIAPKLLDYQRIPSQRWSPTSDELRAQETKKYCGESISGFPSEIFTCQTNRNSEQTIVIWGDSHAQHLVAGFVENFPRANIAVAYLSGCIPQSGFNGIVYDAFTKRSERDDCIKRNHELLTWSKNAPEKTSIFLSSMMRIDAKTISDANTEILNILKKNGVAGYVLGDFIRPQVDLANCTQVPSYIISDQALEKACTPNFTYIEKQLSYWKSVSSLTSNFIPVFESQCPDDLCNYRDSKNRITYRDLHHLSPSGSIYEINKAKEMLIKFAPELASAQSRS